MWQKHSEMLAPLTDLVGECRETKNPQKEQNQKETLVVGVNPSTSI
jgi:hypothetical protein